MVYSALSRLVHGSVVSWQDILQLVPISKTKQKEDIIQGSTYKLLRCGREFLPNDHLVARGSLKAVISAERPYLFTIKRTFFGPSVDSG